jgi:acyl-CoA synthetase (AMP-forming)/AMP-acid ligase II
MTDAPTPRDVYDAATIARFYARGYWTDETLADVLDRRAEQHPSRSLAIENDVVLSNADARAAAYRVAMALRDLGIRLGDRVAVQLPNWTEFVVTYLALARLGAIAVPLLTAYRYKEVAFVLDATEAVAYVGTSAAGGFDHLAMVRELQRDRATRRQIVTVRSMPERGEVAYEELVAGGRNPGDHELGPRPHPDAGHVIGFTSGTEAQPKGCFHTWNTYSFTPRLQRRIYRVTPDDVELVVSPVTHTAGLAAGVLKPLVSGAAMCLVPKWSPETALDLIGRHRASMATGATPFIAMLAEAYDPRRHDVSSFRMFCCGGAPVPAALIQRVRDTLGATELLPVYGQTESLIVTTCVPGEGLVRAASSSGRAVEGAEVAVLDGVGAPRPTGEVGEVCYRTPGAMLGYWRNPVATAAVIDSNGWRRSGDLGFVDRAGYLQITGRIKDMIIRGGLNISSGEVEELLEMHPAVAATAVVGVPDPRLGERVGAFVVPDGPEPTLADLTGFLEREFRLAKQKLPEVLFVVRELPMTATGKVNKQALRARLSGTV